MVNGKAENEIRGAREFIQTFLPTPEKEIHILANEGTECPIDVNIQVNLDVDYQVQTHLFNPTNKTHDSEAQASEAAHAYVEAALQGHNQKVNDEVAYLVSTSSSPVTIGQREFSGDTFSGEAVCRAPTCDRGKCRCAKCHGHGKLTCPKCHGTVRLKDTQGNPYPCHCTTGKIKCLKCTRGFVICTACHGTGEVLKSITPIFRTSIDTRVSIATQAIEQTNLVLWELVNWPSFLTQNGHWHWEGETSVVIKPASATSEELNCDITVIAHKGIHAVSDWNKFGDKILAKHRKAAAKSNQSNEKALREFLDISAAHREPDINQLPNCVSRNTFENTQRFLRGQGQRIKASVENRFPILGWLKAAAILAALFGFRYLNVAISTGAWLEENANLHLIQFTIFGFAFVHLVMVMRTFSGYFKARQLLRYWSRVIPIGALASGAAFFGFLFMFASIDGKNIDMLLLWLCYISFPILAMLWAFLPCYVRAKKSLYSYYQEHGLEKMPSEYR